MNTKRANIEQISSEPAEGWSIDSRISEQVIQSIFRVLPVLRNLHDTFPLDILYVCLDSIQYLYENEKFMPKRLNSKHSIWSASKPFPFNCLPHKESVLDVWDGKTKGTNPVIFKQTKTDLLKILELWEANYDKNILLFCTHTAVGPSKSADVCECILIRYNYKSDKYSDIQMISNPDCLKHPLPE